MKLIDMRQANSYLYPQAVFDEVCHAIDRSVSAKFTRDIMGNKCFDLVTLGLDIYYTYSDLETMEDVEVITPAQVIGRAKLDDIMIGRAPIHQPSVSLPTAASILEAGLGHMKDRAATYDKPEGERSIEATVKAFNAVTGDGSMNTEERGWLFMLLLKAVRSQQGNFKQDNYEDGAAYFGLMGEAAAKERNNG